MPDERKICNQPTIKSTPCRSRVMKGKETCYHHLSQEEKQQQKSVRKATSPSKAYNLTPKRDLIKMLGDKDIQIETLREMITKLKIATA